MSHASRIPAMRSESLWRKASRRFLIALLAVALWPGVAATQEGSAGTAPPNAHMKRYGGGWECDRGYQKRAESCIPVEVPSNGYLDASGRDWACERGFKKGRRSCLALQLPTHAHLGYSGNRWACDPGYRQRGETCTVVNR
jgi:hypothetical protein